jgi:hypothetical protein
VESARDEMQEYIGQMISLICTGDPKQDKSNMKDLVNTIHERSTALFNASLEQSKTDQNQLSL